MIAKFVENWPFSPVFFVDSMLQKTVYPVIRVPSHTDHQNPRKRALINAVCQLPPQSKIPIFLRSNSSNVHCKIVKNIVCNRLSGPTRHCLLSFRSSSKIFWNPCSFRTSCVFWNCWLHTFFLLQDCVLFFFWKDFFLKKKEHLFWKNNFWWKRTLFWRAKHFF